MKINPSLFTHEIKIILSDVIINDDDKGFYFKKEDFEKAMYDFMKRKLADRRLIIETHSGISDHVELINISPSATFGFVELCNGTDYIQVEVPNYIKEGLVKMVLNNLDEFVAKPIIFCTTSTGNVLQDIKIIGFRLVLRNKKSKINVEEYL